MNMGLNIMFICYFGSVGIFYVVRGCVYLRGVG